VVTTAAFITGHSLGDECRARIVDACERGGSSIFGSGINPRLVDLFATVAAGGCERVDKITVIEEADISGYDSAETEIPVGFSHPIDHPGLLAMTTEDVDLGSWTISAGCVAGIGSAGTEKSTDAASASCASSGARVRLLTPIGRSTQGTESRSKAAPAINAIPKTVAAVPGIVTYADILPLPRGLVTL
jgi:hypothetical protein